VCSPAEYAELGDEDHEAERESGGEERPLATRGIGHRRSDDFTERERPGGEHLARDQRRTPDRELSPDAPGAHDAAQRDRHRRGDEDDGGSREDRRSEPPATVTSGLPDRSPQASVSGESGERERAQTHGRQREDDRSADEDGEVGLERGRVERHGGHEEDERCLRAGREDHPSGERQAGAALGHPRERTDEREAVLSREPDQHGGHRDVAREERNDAAATRDLRPDQLELDEDHERG